MTSSASERGRRVAPLARLARWCARLALAAAVALWPAVATADGGGSREYLLRVAAGELPSVLATHNLREDPRARREGDLYVVFDDDDRDEGTLEAQVRADARVAGFEPNRALVLVETLPEVSLNQSTAAILESLQEPSGRATATFFGREVWARYVDQPATQIVKVGVAHTRSRTGGGIVAIIDTGIDASHPALQGVLVPGYDFTRNTADPSELADLAQSTAAILEQSTAAILERDRVAALNQSTAAILEQSTAAILEGLPPGERPPAAFGHGTMVAGLVHRVAPTARIMPLKAFRGDGTSQVFDIVRAVRYAVANGARVINLSFSLSLAVPESLELKRALDEAEARGVVCIASAGNDGLEQVVFPAAWSQALGVGSTTDLDLRSAFSNWGDEVFEVGAPGESVITTWPAGRFAAAWGTSFSTAIVSGAAAALVDPAVVPGSTEAVAEADLIRSAIRAGATRLAGSGLGKGRLDLDASVTERGAFKVVPPPPPPPAGDADGDGMPDADEARFGLDPTRQDAAGDADGDGRTNAFEIAAGTHPRGFWTAYLPEGATSAFFDTRLAIANPSSANPARVLLRFQTSTSTSTSVSQFIDLAPHARRTIDVKPDVPGLSAAEFSTVVESDVPIALDRTMTWDASGYGSDAERGITIAPGPLWYLAEGATHSGFDLFYLIQNPGTATAVLEVTFLRPAPLPPVVVPLAVPPGRFTVWVNTIPGLEATDVSGIVRSTNGVPILVERSMFLGTAEGAFGAGHAGTAVPAPARSWFFAEGATGPYFDTFVLVANPGDQAVAVDVAFLRPSGEPIVQRHVVAARSRYNVWVDLADPRLADTPVSTTVDVVGPGSVIAERAMWWPGQQWREAHNSVGATETATRWASAEGEQGGPRSCNTYLLLSNASALAGRARVTLLFEDGTTAAREFPLPPGSRTNVAVGNEFPEAEGRRFGSLIESLGLAPVPLVVERAMYSDAGGVAWAAGTSALATRLP